MACNRAYAPAKHLFTGFRSYQHPSQCFSRPLSTVTTDPAHIQAKRSNAIITKAYNDARLNSAPTTPRQEDKISASLPSTITQPYQPPPNPFRQSAQCTLYNFPSLEPISFVEYPDTHLLLPLRKDILHRAVIYEGDATRQGTASTKWRSEIHGSNRKVRPQKGSGKARLGDKKSPMLKGGGVAFGPKPRDFSTDLPRKVYDRAWRTALSYRYRKGELIVTEGEIDIRGVHENSLERYLADVLKWNALGNHFGQKHGKSVFVTSQRRAGLFHALEGGNIHQHAKAMEAQWVDVKDLLGDGRLVIERMALERIFKEHESDLPEARRLKL